MNLFQYFGEYVTIQDCNGVVWHGFSATYTPAIDAEDGREEIAVRTSRGLIGFHEDEIRTIKIEKRE